VPVGTPGELIVRCDRPWEMTAGYWNLPEKTANAWRNGWFHTGDLLTCDDNGYYYFVDRNKDCIRRRGENISSSKRWETAIVPGTGRPPGSR
jgi:crotonobetaine/carnitine-CoA ligase